MSSLTDTPNDNLNVLIGVLHDGVDFYERARTRVSDSAAATLFAKMIDERRNAIADFAPLLTRSGRTPPSHGTIVGEARQLLARAKTFVQDTRSAYFSELARLENATAATITTCIEETDNPEIRSVLAGREAPFRAAAGELQSLSG